MNKQTGFIRPNPPVRNSKLKTGSQVVLIAAAVKAWQSHFKAVPENWELQALLLYLQQERDKGVVPGVYFGALEHLLSLPETDRKKRVSVALAQLGLTASEKREAKRSLNKDRINKLADATPLKVIFRCAV